MIYKGMKSVTDSKLSQKECSCFDLDKYILPIWQGNIVYNESVLPLKNADGNIDATSLAYDISEVYEVRSADLKTLYLDGRDYIVENGKLHILPQGKIPLLEYTEYYPAENGDNTKARTGGGNILFVEGGYFHTKQIAVTYSHIDGWKYSVPEKQGGNINKTLEKLKNKQDLKMAFLGDSIYTGCNASGTPFGGDQEPFMPSWFEMLTRVLKKEYGYDGITYINRSRGGQKSYWGREMVLDFVAKEKPDIAFFGFGMNDRETPLEDYFNNILGMMETVRDYNPKCEFVLTAPMLANKEAAGYYRQQYLFVNELNKLKGDGVAVMDVTSVHSALLERKSYRDMTGNNINHPNDFLCRIYAQVALSCFKQ